MSDLFTSELLSPLHASAAMRGVMTGRARLQRMLSFEAALARAEGAVGAISGSGAIVISEACRADRFDVQSLMEAASRTGDAAGALVEALIVEVAKTNPEAASFVHWGASTQDVLDTALVLELRAAIDVLLVDLDTAIKAFAALAGRHRRAVVAVRAKLQQATPAPFGLKLAGYAGALGRSRDRLLRLRREALVLQFGGTGGTLAALHENGAAVAERLAAVLDLPPPDAPWHAHRDRLVEVGACFAILAGTCGKIARDISLMLQVELGEIVHPHRHLSNIATVLSAAAQAPSLASTLMSAMAHDYEGGHGQPQIEWLTFPALALVTSGALEAVVKIAEGLEIDVERMRANLDRSGGRVMSEALFYALALRMDRGPAQKLMQEFLQRSDEQRRPLKDVVMADLRIKARLSSVEVEKLFQPQNYLGSAQFFIDRLVRSVDPRASRNPDFLPAEPTLPNAPQLSGSSGAEFAEIDDDALPSLQAPEDDGEDALFEAEVPARDAEPRVSRAKPSSGAADDTRGAFMDVLSRADAEARAEEEERKRS